MHKEHEAFFTNPKKFRREICYSVPARIRQATIREIHITSRLINVNAVDKVKRRPIRPGREHLRFATVRANLHEPLVRIGNIQVPRALMEREPQRAPAQALRLLRRHHRPHAQREFPASHHINRPSITDRV